MPRNDSTTTMENGTIITRCVGTACSDMSVIAAPAAAAAALSGLSLRFHFPFTSLHFHSAHFHGFSRPPRMAQLLILSGFRLFHFYVFPTASGQQPPSHYDLWDRRLVGAVGTEGCERASVIGTY
jgi:hypothetical protein